MKNNVTIVWNAACKEIPKARGQISYLSLFGLFLIGSVLGFVLEGTWCILTKGHWEHHAATVWGPFCIIYGIGLVVVYLLSVLLKSKNPLLQFFAFTISGAAVEYFSSLFQEICFASVSWDYSNHLLNIGGRVSLKMALLWGILGILFIRFVFPFLSYGFTKMRGNSWRLLCVVLTVFMVVNLAVTFAAVTRWKDRKSNISPATQTARLLDRIYDNNAMETLFPNMVFTKD